MRMSDRAVDQPLGFCVHGASYAGSCPGGGVIRRGGVLVKMRYGIGPRRAQ